MRVSLEGMTQSKWDALSARDREESRSTTGLTPQLVGLEGWRVEVRDFADDKPRRFIVGRSTGWVPCHIEVKTIRSSSGISAMQEYYSVHAIRKER